MKKIKPTLFFTGSVSKMGEMRIIVIPKQLHEMMGERKKVRVIFEDGT